VLEPHSGSYGAPAKPQNILKAPLCKGSSRVAGEGLFLLSFCRDYKSTVCTDNSSVTAKAAPPPFTQRRLIKLVGRLPLHKGGFYCLCYTTAAEGAFLLVLCGSSTGEAFCLVGLLTWEPFLIPYQIREVFPADTVLYKTRDTLQPPPACRSKRYCRRRLRLPVPSQ